MKKAICVVFSVIVILAVFLAVKVITSKVGTSEEGDKAAPETSVVTEVTEENTVEIRAVWISYFELTTMNDSDKSENAFRQKAKKMIEDCAKNDINTVYLHVRPSSDAFYRSDIYPFSMYLTGIEGKDPGYDPLAIFCEYGEQYCVDIHAWINPFRVCSVSNLPTRSDKNPAVNILNDENSDNDDMVVTVGNGVYYNPSLQEVHKLVTDGVKEILSRYNVKGIHIDDYFYPTTDASVDFRAYEEYQKNGGGLSLAQWRRESMNAFVSAMYNTVKSFGEDKIFSISPEADITENYDENFADVKKWASESGYCDYLIPQIYYGFEHSEYPFAKMADEWNKLQNESEIPIVYGLGVYKKGETDKYAGDGSDEWIENDSIIPSQIEYVRNLDSYGGYALYSYSYAF